ncbi:MAG TPA: hypothetical protein VGF28_17670 [Thermoanaerobaculia bacterium]
MQLGTLQRVASAVRRVFGRGREESTTTNETMMAAAPEAADRGSSNTTPTPARTTRRETDIPLDLIGRTYTPPFTGGKAGFRSDGADHQNDQEFAYGVSDERWNDEDRLTNKSGDPRIGTHRRTYEPGESTIESRE